MKISFVNLAEFLMGLPADDETKTFILGEEDADNEDYPKTREEYINKTMEWLKGDINLTVADGLGAMILIDDADIIMPSMRDGIEKTLEAMHKAGELATDDSKYPEFASHFDFCDGGDDLDYAGTFVDTLADLIEGYLKKHGPREDSSTGDNTNGDAGLRPGDEGYDGPIEGDDATNYYDILPGEDDPIPTRKTN